MDLERQFVDALQRAADDDGGPLGPSRWCAVVGEVLGVPGAGLIMARRLVRVPVGASGEAARVAEELQASLGEGPCLAAEATGSVLVADEADLGRRWPVYLQELRRRTPFRSVLSFPILHEGEDVGALDLYSEEPVWRLEEELDVVQSAVVDVVGMLLTLRRQSLLRQAGRGYLDRQRDRQLVFVAVGMVKELTGSSEVDAIAVLRGYTYRTGQLLDDVATSLVHGRLDPADVLAAP